MYPVNDSNERQQIEWVFSLTGGELADKPLRLAYPNPHLGAFQRRWIRYWFEGRPDYLPHSNRGAWITVVACELFGSLPSRIQAHGRKWRKVARYGSSGETGCPLHGEPIPEGTRCPLCDGGPREDHGYIYLGDGWGETVYYSRD